MKERTALVTGANRGLGFETALQLFEAGFRRIVLGCRDLDRGRAAADELAAVTGSNVYQALRIDTADVAGSRRSVEELQSERMLFDFVVLNAGSASDKLVRSRDGFDTVYASTLIGHHVLVAGLLAGGLLGEGARVVIAASEIARADRFAVFPRVRVEDFKRQADVRYGGDVAAAMIAVARGQQDGRYRPYQEYATAKMMVAWWAAALARRLPDQMAVFAISPGAAPDTGFADNWPFTMRKLVVPAVRSLGVPLRLSHSVTEGAARYLRGLELPSASSGGFFASPSNRLTGPLVEQRVSHLLDQDLQEACWQSLERIVGGA